MTLRLRHIGDQYPHNRWPRDGTDWVVMSGETIVGRIMRLNGGPADGRWLWSITCAVPQPEWCRGVAATREDAQAAFKAAWLAHGGSIEVDGVDVALAG